MSSEVWDNLKKFEAVCYGIWTHDLETLLLSSSEMDWCKINVSFLSYDTFQTACGKHGRYVCRKRPIHAVTSAGFNLWGYRGVFVTNVRVTLVTAPLMRIGYIQMMEKHLLPMPSHAVSPYRSMTAGNRPACVQSRPVPNCTTLWDTKYDNRDLRIWSNWSHVK